LRYPKLIVLALVMLLCSCGGKQKEELYAEGQQALQSGNARGAIVLLKSALEKDPNYVPARSLLGDVYTAVGKLEMAEREYLKIKQQQPANSGVLLSLAELYNRMHQPQKALDLLLDLTVTATEKSRMTTAVGTSYALQEKYTQAEDFFRQAIVENSAYIQAYLELARLQARKGEIASAKENLETLLKVKPDYGRALEMLASLYRMENKPVEALEIFKKLADTSHSRQALYMTSYLLLEQRNLDSAAIYIEQFTTRYSKDMRGQQLKGLMAFLHENYDGAIVELTPVSEQGADPLSSYYLGLSYFEKKSYELALSSFHRVLDKQPTNQQARIMTAMTLLRQKRGKEALQEAERGLKQYGDIAIFHNLVGSAAMQVGDYDRAMSAFDKALIIDPDIPDVLAKRGAYNQYLGHQKEAGQDLRKAVASDPEALEYRFILARYYLQQKNFSEALKVLNSGLREQPRDAVILNSMAAVYLAKKENSEAIIALQNAITRNPDFFAPYFNLANLYAVKQQYPEALALFSRLLDRNPDNGRALDARGSLYLLQNDNEKAEADYRHLAELGSNAGVVRYASFLQNAKRTDESLRVLDAGIVKAADKRALMLAKGRFLLTLNRQDDAVALLKKLKEIDEQAALMPLINILVRQGDADKALQIATEYKNRKMRDTAGYLLSSMLLERMGRADEAEDVLENGLIRADNRTQIQLQMAAFYNRRGYPGKAEERFRIILQKEPTNVEALFGMALLMDQKGRKADAVKRYKTVLKLSKNYVPALNNLAYLYLLEFGEKEQALDLAMRAYRKAPQSADVVDTLGYALLINGKATESVKVLERVAKNNNPTILYHLALAYSKTGQKEKAQILLKKLENAGDFPEKENAEKLLRQL